MDPIIMASILVLASLGGAFAGLGILRIARGPLFGPRLDQSLKALEKGRHKGAESLAEPAAHRFATVAEVEALGDRIDTLRFAWSKQIEEMQGLADVASGRLKKARSAEVAAEKLHTGNGPLEAVPVAPERTLSREELRKLRYAEYKARR